MGTIGLAIACYNTPEHIRTAVNSVFRHVDNVMIIDNSSPDDLCVAVCDELAELPNVEVIHIGRNIGHGPAIALALECLKNELIIIMDSDAELLDPSLIDDMRKAMQEGIYGAGDVFVNSSYGYNVPYLVGHFCMIRRRYYFEHYPFINNGAIMIYTMVDIMGKKRLANIKDFNERVFHEGRATRKVAGNWRHSFGGRNGV